MKPKAAYFTLGCKLNFAETSTIGKYLKERGIEKINDTDIPDICVINTCSVTEAADKKGRQLIKRLVRDYPDATIVVTGCYAQLKPDEIAQIEGVDLILGSNEKLRIAEYIDDWLKTRETRINVTDSFEIKEFQPSCERGDRTRFFLKVQDGCDYFCTYCTIPFARGRSRSGAIPELVELAREAAEAGGREIVITGVNIGEFGKGSDSDFFQLLKELDKVDGIERYRISSIEPNLLTEEMIRWIAFEAKHIAPHFHIPLQSGSDKVLKLMNRRYDTTLFKERINLINSLIPDAFIGVDIIAGSRGETPEEWEKSRNFAENLDVAKYHVFPYSERNGTKALLLGDFVEKGERHRRANELIRISEKKTFDFYKKNIGKVRKVLWEKEISPGILQGHTENYIPVEAKGEMSLLNCLSEVKITGFSEKSKDSMAGEILKVPNS